MDGNLTGLAVYAAGVLAVGLVMGLFLPQDSKERYSFSTIMEMWVPCGFIALLWPVLAALVLMGAAALLAAVAVGFVFAWLSYGMAFLYRKAAAMFRRKKKEEKEET